MSTATLHTTSRGTAASAAAVGSTVRDAAPRPAAVRPRPQVAHRSALRLTGRGRLLVTALALLAALVCFVAVSAGTQAGSSATPVVHTEVVVQPGQTLWELAQELAPSVDPRATVRAIVSLNGLDGAGVDAGQRLRLPAVAG